MTSPEKKIFLPYFSIIVAIILLDQITKNFMLDKIGFNSTGQFIPGIVQFTVVQNTGGAFSIFKEHPFCFQLIGIFNIILFTYLTFAKSSSFSTITKLGCASILAGTVGNSIDRFLRGGVVDFLDLQFINFAVFNLADVFIDIGIALILIEWVVQRNWKPN